MLRTIIYYLTNPCELFLIGTTLFGSWVLKNKKIRKTIRFELHFNMLIHVLF
jgi:hypothetical protein